MLFCMVHMSKVWFLFGFPVIWTQRTFHLLACSKREYITSGTLRYQLGYRPFVRCGDLAKKGNVYQTGSRPPALLPNRTNNTIHKLRRLSLWTKNPLSSMSQDLQWSVP